MTCSVPLDGIVLNTETGCSGWFGGVSDSERVSRESELNLDARFGGPNLVNRPRRGYRLDPDGAGCLQINPSFYQKFPYDEDNLTPGVSC